MKYFTGDPHVFHKNIIKYDELPFKTLNEYREYFIKVWNDTVTNDDEVYLLGDIAVGGTNSQVNNFLHQLNGTIYLIKGNHDGRTLKCSYIRDHFEWIKDYHVFDYEKQRFVLMHFPIEEWQNKQAGKSIHLHAHSHGKLNKRNEEKKHRRLDVGFKANNFKILSIDEIINKINNVT